MVRVGIGVAVKPCALGGFLVTAVRQNRLLAPDSNGTAPLTPPPPSQLADNGCARPHLRVGDRILSLDGVTTEVHFPPPHFKSLFCYGVVTAGMQGLGMMQMRELMLGAVGSTVHVALGALRPTLTFYLERLKSYRSPWPRCLQEISQCNA